MSKTSHWQMGLDYFADGDFRNALGHWRLSAHPSASALVDGLETALQRLCDHTSLTRVEAGEPVFRCDACGATVRVDRSDFEEEAES